MKAYQVRIDCGNQNEDFQDLMDEVTLPSSIIVFANSEGEAIKKFKGICNNQHDIDMPYKWVKEMGVSKMNKYELYPWCEDLQDVDTTQDPINYFEYILKHGEDSFVNCE